MVARARARPSDAYGIANGKLQPLQLVKRLLFPTLWKLRLANTPPPRGHIYWAAVCAHYLQHGCSLKCHLRALVPVLRCSVLVGRGQGRRRGGRGGEGGLCAGSHWAYVTEGLPGRRMGTLEVGQEVH